MKVTCAYVCFISPFCHVKDIIGINLGFFPFLSQCCFVIPSEQTVWWCRPHKMSETHPAKWHNQPHALMCVIVILRLCVCLWKGIIFRPFTDHKTHRKRLLVCVYFSTFSFSKPKQFGKASLTLARNILSSNYPLWWKWSRQIKTDKTKDVYHNVMGNRADFGVLK